MRDSAHKSAGARPVCLVVEASPRGDRSGSTALARLFIDQLSHSAPDLEVDRLSLWDEPLPEFNGAMIAAKYAVLAGRPWSVEEARAWAIVKGLVNRIRRASALVIATPMWNMGVPYKLKHWIDLITQPGLSFSFEPKTGYAPLLEDRPVLVILSSAGDFSTGSSWGRPDLATPYLSAACRFIGLKDLVFVPVAPTVGAEADVSRATEHAGARLRELAPGFLTPPS